jgi:hypothetical protein
MSPLVAHVSFSFRRNLSLPIEEQRNRTAPICMLTCRRPPGCGHVRILGKPPLELGNGNECTRSATSIQTGNSVSVFLGN